MSTAWITGVKESISSNFAHFGILKDPSFALEKVTFNDYYYYASGRQHCKYALFKIELKKRQCLFSTCTMEMIWPKRDMVTIEVPIVIPEYQENGVTTNHIPLEFMIVRKRNMKSTFSNFGYLKNFVGPVLPKSLVASDLVVLAESDEAGNHIIDSYVGE
jgi:Protein of unknown function (DUF1682)